MADDIVTRLRQEAAQCNASPCDCQCPNLIAAADEIERLRAAGDAMASAFEEIPQWPEWFYKVYETWLEARRD